MSSSDNTYDTIRQYLQHSSQHRQTCTTYWLVFEQRFVAKYSTSLNLSKRFQTRVSEHSIYYCLTAHSSTAIFTHCAYAVFIALWKHTGQQQFLDKSWRTALRGVRFLNTGGILGSRVNLSNSTKLSVIHCTLKCSTRAIKCVYSYRTALSSLSKNGPLY